LKEWEISPIDDSIAFIRAVAICRDTLKRIKLHMSIEESKSDE